MGILDTLARRFGYLTQDDIKALPRPGAFYPANGTGNGIAYGGPMTFPGWQTYDQNATGDRDARKALTNAWVYSNIAAIAREFSAAQIVVKVRTGEDLKDVTNHELEQLWRKPNPIMSRSFVAEYWAYSRFLFGESYLYMAPAGSKIKELWPIPAQRMTPVQDETLVIREYHYKVRPDSKPTVIPAEYVLYSRTPNPFNPLRGLPVMNAAMLAIDTDLAQAQWNRNFFGKFNAVPSAVISLKPDVLETDFIRFRQELFDFFGGTNRRTMVARGGDVDVKMFGTSQKEMDFLGGRELNKAEIDRVFGIPEGYWSADATRANSSHAGGVLTNNVIWPMLVGLAEDLNNALVPTWYPDNIVIEFEDIRPRDRELALRETASRLSYWTINELRHEEGKDDLDGEIFELLPATAALAIASQGIVDMPEDEPIEEVEEDDTPPDVATDPELAAALNGGELPPASEEFEAATEQMTKALGLWERKALRRIKSHGKAACGFEDPSLPKHVKTSVLASLESAQTADAVRDAFKAIRIIPRGVDEPVAPLPDTVTVDDSDIGRAVDFWAEIMKDTDYAGILNAKAIGLTE